MDGTIVVKIYTANEAALRKNLEEVSKKVTFGEIYEKVFDVVNKEKTLWMWDPKNEKSYCEFILWDKIKNVCLHIDLPMEKVKEVMEKVKEAKAKLDGHIDKIKSNEFKKRAEISRTNEEQVEALNNAVNELKNIAEG